MGKKIIVCGGNGAGKSTLGKQLAKELGWEFRDIEEYYFPKNNSDYTYQTARTREDVARLLADDLNRYDNLVLASVKGNYGDEVEAMFSCAVFISVPKEIRMKRVWDRSHQKFGDRMLQGGDLYEQEQHFFDMVKQRSEKDVTDWLQSIEIPVIQVDGTQTVEENIKKIMRVLENENIDYQWFAENKW